MIKEQDLIVGAAVTLVVTSTFNANGHAGTYTGIVGGTPGNATVSIT